MYICISVVIFGSIPIQLMFLHSMTKVRARLQLETSEFIRVKRWYDENKKSPAFKHLVVKAYRDWTALTYINTKIVVRTAYSKSKVRSMPNHKFTPG